jgi:hypothetical protein
VQVEFTKDFEGLLVDTVETEDGSGKNEEGDEDADDDNKAATPFFLLVLPVVLDTDALVSAAADAKKPTLRVGMTSLLCFVASAAKKKESHTD